MRKDRLMTGRSSSVPPYVVIALSILLSGGSLPGSGGALAAEEAEAAAAQEVFLANKCNLCHAVPAAEIEAKTKSKTLKGKDLGGPVEEDFEVIAAYLRKQSELEGKSHKKEFKGSDEELQVILDWLAGLEPEETEGSQVGGSR